ncbi:carboxymuconolactone decarboxylase [Burkholderia sp. AU31652]|uniref:carboxymuconolactone decarboxylase family protein n=1 Tax=Burkholderia sp. AU31652 TaxID=2015354 RepID=UPI000B79D6FB|nr:carboxymuconolactone decarboxylase family protein [Burkholderia sp. AU31652]OXI84719.1 carboxymuconolactone decarboxylase [Burkholderia sp. AU31652]
MTQRIASASPPFEPDITASIDRIMQGHPPLRLFTTLARDPRLFTKFFAAGLLDKGHLDIRQREIVIDRTTALCGCEYEWGVHVAVFARTAKLSSEQIRSLACGSADDTCWNDDDRVLIRMCDALHRHCDIDDDLWHTLCRHFSDEARLELLMLAGFYRTVSYLANALRLPLEAHATRFPSRTSACEVHSPDLPTEDRP